MSSKIVLIKSELFKQGGLEKYTWQIAQDFCSRGISVTLLTSGEPNPPFISPLLNIVSLPVRHALSVLNVIHFDRACSKYLDIHPTSIVFSLDRNRFQTHIRAGNGAHAAYLEHRSTEEGLLKRASFVLNPLHRAILSLEKRAFENPNLKVLFANSEMVKEQILKFYFVDPEKIAVVHNGVEWQSMQNAFDRWEPAKEENMQRIALDPAAFQFLFIGHNFLRKGLEKLLHALSWIKTENFQLNIVGKEKNLKYFEQLTYHLGIKKKVVFHGPQADSTAFYQIADCTVIPSLYDPFANVTVEALSMGNYIISSRQNGGHEILSSLTGSKIESLNDVQSFSELLRSTLSKRKTTASAKAIRESIKHLDFSNQLKLITETTLRAS